MFPLPRRLGLALLLWAFVPAIAAGSPPDLQALADAPRWVLPAERLPAPSENPRQFAVAVPAAIGAAHGRWQRDTALALWRLRIASPGATSLSLHLAAPELPAGAELWLYDAAGSVVHGPYPQPAAGNLWTPIVPGDELVLEARLPATAVAGFRLGGVTVFHGFRDWDKARRDRAKSGACNIDVACPQGAAWHAQVRSVARITIANQFLCSGQLVNNTREDGTPYFLTADHCGIGDDPGDHGPASSVVFYWNYQTSGCGGPRDGSLEQTLSGSEFVADDLGADVTLLRIASPLPPSFNTYFAGWDVTPMPPQSGAGIHHPSGDEKRISLFTDPAQPSQGQFPGSGRTIAGWQVRWSEGVTEGGSSGSGLWNQDQRVVGVLSYGDTSCENPNGTDVYGRLDAAWTAAPDPSGQLKAHLDPDNTGATALNGRNGPGGSSSRPDGGGSYSVGAVPLATLALLCLGAALPRRFKAR